MTSRAFSKKRFKAAYFTSRGREAALHAAHQLGGLDAVCALIRAPSPLDVA